MTPRPTPVLAIAPSLTSHALELVTQPSSVLPSNSEVIRLICSSVVAGKGCGGGAFISSPTSGAVGGTFVPGCANTFTVNIIPKVSKQVVFMAKKWLKRKCVNLFFNPSRANQQVENYQLSKRAHAALPPDRGCVSRSGTSRSNQAKPTGRGGLYPSGIPTCCGWSEDRHSRGPGQQAAHSPTRASEISNSGLAIMADLASFHGSPPNYAAVTI